MGTRAARWKGVSSGERSWEQCQKRQAVRGLRKKGMSKSRAAAISNSPGASSRGGESSGSSRSKRSSGSGGNQSQKKAASRKGGKIRLSASGKTRARLS